MKLLITADWHIRATKPRCRVEEDWIDTQRDALSQIAKIAVEKEATVCVVGDLFDRNSDVSFACISLVQEFSDSVFHIRRNAKGFEIPECKTYVLAGNHDLPYHSSENIDKSAIGVLLKSQNIRPMKQLSGLVGCSLSAPNFDEKVEDAEIVFRHILTFPDAEHKPPFSEGVTAQDLLDETPNAKWVFTGDYHHNFHYENKGRHVINSGCLIRQVSDMKDYKCGVYFVDTDTEEVEFVEIKDNYDLVDDSYILKQNEREERIEKFVDKLKDTKNVSLDFSENVRKAISENKISGSLKETIDELMEV